MANIIDSIKGLFNEKINIEELLTHRTDLSTFIVHLTRTYNKKSASDNLKSIITSWNIEARSCLGFDKDFLKKNNSKVISFTETPLEYLYILTEKIKGRQCEFEPYGIAITKKLARKNSVNPVWYIDMTPGPDWVLQKALKALSNIKNTDANDALKELFPFIEQMGDWRMKGGTCKEFWWEREWRHAGNLKLPDHVIGLCPEHEIADFEKFAASKNRNIRFIDPRWGMEKIIARMANFNDDEINIL